MLSATINAAGTALINAAGTALLLCISKALEPQCKLWACLQVCVETMMHLTCTNMPQDKLRDALDKVSTVNQYIVAN